MPTPFGIKDSQKVEIINILKGCPLLRLFTDVTVNVQGDNYQIWDCLPVLALHSSKLVDKNEEESYYYCVSELLSDQMQIDVVDSLLGVNVLTKTINSKSSYNQLISRVDAITVSEDAVHLSTILSTTAHKQLIQSVLS
jgi:hypothetical protein